MSDNRTRIWFSLFVLAVFCVGLASGLILGRRLGPPPRDPDPRFIAGAPGPGGGAPPRRLGPPPRDPDPRFIAGAGAPGPGGGAPPRRLLERLDEVLKLTPDQHAQVEQIFESRRKGLEAVQNEVIARAQKEQQELQAEIRKVLTPEQQERFDRWLAESPRGGRRGRGPGMGPGPMGPPPPAR